MKTFHKGSIGLFFAALAMVLAGCSDAQPSSTSEIQKYKVFWKNYDGVVLQSQIVNEGEAPTYSGSTPEKEPNTYSEYTFSGWSPEVGPIYMDTDYYAKYTSSPRKYNITWVNDDNTVITTQKTEYGTVPTYSGKTPTKASSDSTDYTFKSWDPAPVAVSCDAVYKATYAESARCYNITWKNYDGKVITTTSAEYGSMPSYHGETPTRAGTSDISYEFSGWSPDLDVVHGNQTYVAQYKANKLTYDVTWKNYDGTILATGKTKAGTVPSYDGVTPTKPGSESVQYVFSGWTPAPTPIDRDMVFTAEFKEVSLGYVATFVNYDGSVLASSRVKEGETPVYSGTTPTRATADRIQYTFKGWEPELAPIHEDTKYTAVYNETSLGYTINFDFDGGTSSYASSKVVFTLDASDFPYDVVKDGYNFRGWSYNGSIVFNESGKKVSSVVLTDGMTFKAAYSDRARLTLSSSVTGEADKVGGTITGDGEYSYHQSVTVTATPFSGYQFDGWYSDAGVLLSSTSTWNFVMWEKDTQLNAKFSLLSYKLYLTVNKSDLGSVMDSVSTYSASSTKSHVYTKSVTIYACNKNSYYEFLGWYLNDVRVSSNAIYTFTMPCKDYYLEAKWDLFDYTCYGNSNKTMTKVTFDSCGGTDVSPILLSTSSTKAYSIPTKSGYVFRGWSYSKYRDEFATFNDSNYGDFTLFARWEKCPDDATIINAGAYTGSSSTVSFSTSGSKTYCIVSSSSGSFDLCLRNYCSSSYAVAAVVTTLAGETVASTEFSYSSSYQTLTVPCGDHVPYLLTLTKTFSSAVYFYFDGITQQYSCYGISKTGTVSLGETIPQDSITRKGYEFEGFRDDSGKLYSADTPWDSVKDKTDLVASWSPINYTITYVTNNGVFGSDINIDDYETFNVESVITIPTSITHGGYTFQGWYLSADFSGDSVEDTKGIFENITLYAKWETTITCETQYAVSYYTTSTTTPSETAYVANGSTLTQPDSPINSGYMFAGWYTSSDYVTVYDFSQPITQSVSIYAKWSSDYSVSSYEKMSAYSSSSSVKSMSNQRITSCFMANTTGTITIYYKNSSSSSYYRTYLYAYRANGSYAVSTSTYSTSYASTTFTVTAGEILRFYTSYYSSSYSATISFYFSSSSSWGMPTATAETTSATILYNGHFHFDPPAGVSDFVGYYYNDDETLTSTRVTDANGDSLLPYQFTGPISLTISPRY